MISQFTSYTRLWDSLWSYSVDTIVNHYQVPYIYIYTILPFIIIPRYPHFIKPYSTYRNPNGRAWPPSKHSEGIPVRGLQAPNPHQVDSCTVRSGTFDPRERHHLPPILPFRVFVPKDVTAALFTSHNLQIPFTKPTFLTMLFNV